MERSEKKSNKRVIAIAALLLALIILFAFGGYTMSKYITSRSVTGKAEVAKWGYTVSANTNGLFSDGYQKGVQVGASATGDLDVKVNTGHDSMLVAPGTKGQMSFDIIGSAEVMATIAVSLDIRHEVKLSATLKDAKDGSTTQDIEYVPVRWTLKKGDQVIGDENSTLTKIKSELEKLYKDEMQTTEAKKQNPGTSFDDHYTLSWEWVFESSTVAITGVTSDVTTTNITTDLCDTMLGTISDFTATAEKPNADGEINADADDTYKYWVNKGSDIAFDFSLVITVAQAQAANAPATGA